MAIYDLIYAFHTNFDAMITVSEILAQIDHIGPNWTFLTLQ